MFHYLFSITCFFANIFFSEHPNTKLFISHGGALSTQEAAYFGVPLIAMPFFIDQRIMANEITKKKFGLRMDAAKVTSQITLDHINEILTNPV